MNCPNCGSEIQKDDKFCEHCGYSLNNKDNNKLEAIHQAWIYVGYAFPLLSFIGPFSVIGGYLFGIYFLNRNDPRLKFHGRNILILSVLVSIIWLYIIIKYPF